MGSNVVELVLESLDGGPLPEAPAGSHVDLDLGGGLVRQYSLVDPASARPVSYRIGVKVDVDGRGGSRAVAERLAEGQVVNLSTPRNLFALDEPCGRKVVLVAGGIGITPIHAMASQLRGQPGAEWELHYAFPTADQSYFPSPWLRDDERVELYEGRPTEGSGRRLDVAALVQRAVDQGGADIYCCGPTGLMGELARHAEGRPGIRYFQESFEAPDLAPDGSETGFDVVLARSGQTVRVGADVSILDTVRACGVDAPSSCEQGICGACETKVIAGTPLHRDAILSPGEQAANRTMMICCSRAVTPSLTLDL